MRGLLLVAPLLLTGCALLMPDQSSYQLRTFEHDGYELTCIDIERAACISLADQGALLFRISSSEPIQTIVIGGDGNGPICSASGCSQLRSD